MLADEESTTTAPSMTSTHGSSVPSVGLQTTLSRTSEIPGLKILKSPEEGGTKKEYEDFLEKIINHVTITWGHGKDVAYIIKNTKLPLMTEPSELSDSDAKSRLKMMRWDMEVTRYLAREDALKENSCALFSLLTESVSKITKSKLKSKTGFTESEKTSDVVWLLEKLEDIILNFEDITPKVLALDDQLERIIKLRQGSQDNEDFLKLVKKEIKIYEKHGGRFLWGKTQEDSLDASLKKLQDEKIATDGVAYTVDEMSELKKIETDKLNKEIIAMAMIKRADKKRFGNLQIQLKNSFLLGNNEYPTTVPDVLKILNNYKQEWHNGINPTRNNHNNSNNNNNNNNNSSGVSLLQAQANTYNINYLRGTNGSFFANITCRLCGYKGHYQSHCPVATNDQGHKITNEDAVSSITNSEGGGVRQTRVSIQFNQYTASHTSLNPYWILLDSESTDHFFANQALLTDVRNHPNHETLRMQSSGGTLDTSQQGRFGDLVVWYHPGALGNVLSLARLAQKCRVVMDTSNDNAFYVYLSPSHFIKFECMDSGLYVYDASQTDLPKLRQAFHFLNTVVDNKALYRQRDIRKADDALILNRRLNHIAKDKFQRILRDNWILNNPTTINDVNRSRHIYGPSIPSLKGRTRYQAPPRVSDSSDIITLPASVYENLKHVTLCVDFHYVNGNLVFHTISRNINYRTVSFPNSKSKKSILRELRIVLQKYNARGFVITDIHADNEFYKARHDILPIRLHTVGTDEHVPEIERSVQTQKHENRCTCHAMPYKCIPKVMLRELVTYGNTLLNAFGPSDAIAGNLSPRNIIDNLPHINYNDIKYEFGQYVQLHITQTITNTMHTRTIGAIVMGPRDFRGRYNFLSLETGKEINGRVVAILPITQDVIHAVEQFGLAQKQPYRDSKLLQYEWCPGTLINDDDRAADFPVGPHHIVPPPIQQLGPHALPDAQGADQIGIVNEDENKDENKDDQQQGAMDQQQGAEDDQQQGAMDQQQGAENQGATEQNQGAHQVAREDDHEYKDVEDEEEISIEEEDIHLLEPIKEEEDNEADDEQSEFEDDNEYDLKEGQPYYIMDEDESPEEEIIFQEQDEETNENESIGSETEDDQESEDRKNDREKR